MSKSRRRVGGKKNASPTGVKFLLSPVPKKMNIMTPTKSDIGSLNGNISSQIPLTDVKIKPENQTKIIMGSPNRIKQIKKTHKKKKRRNIGNKKARNNYSERRNSKIKSIRKEQYTEQKLRRILQTEKLPTTAYYQAWLKQYIQKYQGDDLNLNLCFEEMRKKMLKSKKRQVMLSPDVDKMRKPFSNNRISDYSDTFKATTKFSPQIVTPTSIGPHIRRGSMYTNIECEEGSKYNSQNRSSNRVNYHINPFRAQMEVQLIIPK